MTDREKIQKINSMIKQAQKLLEESRKLSTELDRADLEFGEGEFYFDGPAYGMGGFLENGEWTASSHSC